MLVNEYESDAVLSELMICFNTFYCLGPVDVGVNEIKARIAQLN